MEVIKYPKSTVGLLSRPTLDLSEIGKKVQPVLDAVKAEGDTALRRFALEFDKLEVLSFLVESDVLEQAHKQLDRELKDAIDQAYNNIFLFHSTQKRTEELVETMPGVRCWRESLPINKVGIYIPGGTAPLLSTVLMLGIPALIAGCKEVVLCSPSDHPAIYYCAHKCGISKVFRIGGAQAVAAMAFGTETVPRVHKIFGPGNQYVTAAKQLVMQSGVAIDMPAGPSEVAVLADGSANATFIAADLLSQAEHGADSQVVFVTDSEELLTEVLSQVELQVSALPRMHFAKAALENSKAVLVNNIQDGMDLVNEYAPEHLILAVEDNRTWAKSVENAGSVFLGNYTPESCGDYASGTNHTLPTNGHAAAYSGVSVDSFVKKVTFQEITKEGLSNIGDTVMQMAAAEQLEAHKNAVAIRLQ